MEKLFYLDTHIIDFEATVTDCFEAEKKKGYYIVLDRTAFFPEEGGQSADKGTINGKEVLDVQIKEDIIYHLMQEPLEIGSRISGHVDWAQRFDFMQQHTGEHIVSGLIHKHYGFHNVGFHLSVNEVTMDFDGQISMELLREIEAEANRVVWANLAVSATFPSKEVLDTLEYRSKIEIEGAVRIVEIPGVDVCACCAPHVSFTGEIGMIKIASMQSHRGGMRLTLLCGERALQDYTTKQDTCSAISVLLSAKPDLLADAVKKVLEDSHKAKETANQLTNQLLKLQIAMLPTPKQTDHAVLFTELSNTIAIRNTVNELTTRYSGYCAAFTGTDKDGYSFIIGSANKDCRTLAALLREQFHAKCGGSSPMIQGSVNISEEELTAFLQNI